VSIGEKKNFSVGNGVQVVTYKYSWRRSDRLSPRSGPY